MDQKDIHDLCAEIIEESYEHRHEMLKELLYRTLRGERLILVERQTFDRSIVKFEYTWERPQEPTDKRSEFIL